MRLLPSDRMRRRCVLSTVLAVGIASGHGAALAQQRQPLIVVLIHGKESAHRSRLEGLPEGLRELRYVEGRNYRMEVRWSDNQVERLPTLARELLAQRPDVAVGFPVISTQALQRESNTLPIVMASGAGAQRLGLISSLSRPGGNVTGLENQLDELSAKQLEFLKEIAPNAKRVMTLSSGLGAAEPDVRAGSRTAARALGITLIEALADGPAKLAQASQVCERERCEALVVLLDPNVSSFRAEIIAMAAKLRIPSVYPTLEFTDDGGLVAYSTDVRSQFRRAASYVDRILRGAKPADLPVERPTKFELVINLKTARALGIKIPQSVLVRADRVIE
jgi:putative tryptophan/tyrosine transport system substrate-binding protein